MGVCLTSRADANDIAFFSAAVTDDQQSERATQAKKDKAVFASEWSGSSINLARSSTNTDLASSKVTPCFFAFAFAFWSSHSKRSVLIRVV